MAIRLPFRLGVSSFLTQHWPTPEDIRALAYSPVMCVELASPEMWDVSPQQIHETLAALRASGLELWSVHSPFGDGLDLSSLDEPVRGRTLDALRRAFELAANLCCKTVIVHPSAEPIALEERGERLRQAHRSLGKVVAMAQESNIPGAIEPLPRTCLANTADEVAMLLEGAPEDWLGICLDVNHANVGQDLVSFIRRFNFRIITLHISDNDGVDEKHWLPGRGVINWAEVMRALREIGYTGPLVYEVGLDDEGLAQRLQHFGDNHHWLSSLGNKPLLPTPSLA
ncbi:MAG: sugar phosphate isomerase/epimerase [Actinobacteria bacterium]|nr:sugar phosphate isomerase/epimerase [Actinomycetota bacterium]